MNGCEHCEYWDIWEGEEDYGMLYCTLCGECVAMYPDTTPPWCPKNEVSLDISEDITNNPIIFIQ